MMRAGIRVSVDELVIRSSRLLLHLVLIRRSAGGTLSHWQQSESNLRGGMMIRSDEMNASRVSEGKWKSDKWTVVSTMVQPRRYLSLAVGETEFSSARIGGSITIIERHYSAPAQTMKGPR